MARDPRIMRGSPKPDVRFEGTQPLEKAGYPLTERAIRGYTTLEVCGIASNRMHSEGTQPDGARRKASNRTCIPRVRDRRSIRDCLKMRRYSDSTQLSEHEGKRQTERVFRGYATIGACGKASTRTRFSRVRDLRIMLDSVKVRTRSGDTRPSEHPRLPKSENASRRYTTLGACGKAPNRTCFPKVHDPQIARDSLKPNVHSSGTRPSDHAG